MVAAACATCSLALAAAANAARAEGSTAGAAADRGSATITVRAGAPAARQLRRAHVRIQARAGAHLQRKTVRRRKGRGRRVTKATITLPVSGAHVGSSATIGLRGSIRFAGRRRAVRLKRLRLRLGKRRATISASLGGRRRTFFVATRTRGRQTLDRSARTAELRPSRLRLTVGGARQLRRRLGIARLSARSIGRLAVDASSEPRRDGSDTGARRPSGPTQPGAPGVPAPPAPSPAPPSGGPSPGSPPTSGPITNTPPVLPRPATAVPVSAVSITWAPRDSWIRYLSSGTGPGDGIHATGGATAAAPTTSSPCPDVPSSSDALLPYSFSYAPLATSWHDPVSGVSAIYGQGSVRFAWSARGIDLELASPEIEINGASSRAIFRFRGSGGTPFPDQRGVLVELAGAGAPAVSDGGRTFAYTRMRGRLTQDGSSAFGGFYAPGDGFGCVSVQFTTP